MRGDSQPFSSDSDLVARDLTASDLSQVMSLEQLIFGADAWSAALLSQELESPWSTYLGVFDGDRLIAYGGIKGDIEGDLMTVGVLPEYRGRGAGRKLLRSLIEVARQGGMRELFLEVRASNQGARKLYASEGFEELSILPSYYRNPTEDAVTMRLRVS